ncbi:MAG: hypothetical protein J4N67_11930 [Chloroflexi bacterium]|nr:hypothetical protein [Chloroflexota bacterium]
MKIMLTRDVLCCQIHPLNLKTFSNILRHAANVHILCTAGYGIWFLQGSDKLPGWERKLVLVVHGNEIAVHLGNATGLTALDISAIALACDQHDDRWVFGEHLPN